MRKEILEGNCTNKREIFWYAIPAYGHIYSSLYLARCLSEKDFRIVYYSTEEFREVIEANGCVFRSYPIRQEELELSDGQKILKLYRLLLEYTDKMLPFLLKDAVKDRPACVIFDSLAPWGRLIMEQLQIPGFSFYSIIAFRQVGDKGFRAYCKGFSADFLRYASEIPRAVGLKRLLVKKYGKTKLGIKDVLMNKGVVNLMGYSRLFQPGGEKYGKSYHFLGPLAVHRKVIEKNDFDCPNGRIIYISLGTIFNRDEQLLEQLVRQFGRKPDKTSQSCEYSVVMVWDEWNGSQKECFPDNFIVRKFVNQGEVLKRASLFISAGGQNSIHEALYYSVPCLICPQQGEQLVNAERFERLGFGRILRDPYSLRQEACLAMKLRNTWDEDKRAAAIRTFAKKEAKIFHQLLQKNSL